MKGNPPLRRLSLKAGPGCAVQLATTTRKAIQVCCFFGQATMRPLLGKLGIRFFLPAAICIGILGCQPQQEKVVDFVATEDAKFTLVSDSGRNPAHLFLTVTGMVDGASEMAICQPGQSFHFGRKVELVGPIQYRVALDWFSSECLLDYRSSGATGGSCRRALSIQASRNRSNAKHSKPTTTK